MNVCSHTLLFSFVTLVESKTMEIQQTQQLPAELNKAINESIAYLRMVLGELCMITEAEEPVEDCVPEEQVVQPACDLQAVPLCVDLSVLASATLRQDYVELCQ